MQPEKHMKRTGEILVKRLNPAFIIIATEKGPIIRNEHQFWVEHSPPRPENGSNKNEMPSPLEQLYYETTTQGSLIPSAYPNQAHSDLSADP